MLALLLWGFAIYGLMMAIIHAVSGLWKSTAAETITQAVVLIVENGEMYVEGILRTIVSAASFNKGDVQVIVIDTGSTDATSKIVKTFADHEEMIEFYENISDSDISELIRSLRKQSQHVITHLDLRRWEHPKKAIHLLMRMLTTSA
jgi:hypothetical protein